MKFIFAFLFVLVLFSCKKEGDNSGLRVEKIRVNDVSTEDTVQTNTQVELEIVIALYGCDQFERIEKTQNGKQLEFTLYKSHPSEEHNCHVEPSEESLKEEITFSETGLHTLVFNDGALVKEVYVE